VRRRTQDEAAAVVVFVEAVEASALVGWAEAFVQVAAVFVQPGLAADGSAASAVQA